eukprot:314286-Amphidinium_carterae.2
MLGNDEEDRGALPAGLRVKLDARGVKGKAKISVSQESSGQSQACRSRPCQICATRGAPGGASEYRV